MTRFSTALLVGLLAAPAVALAQPAPAPPTTPAAEPTTPEGWFKVGSDHYSLGEYDAAIDAFKKGFALEQVPSKKAAYLFNLGQAYRQKKDCPNASFTFKRFLDIKDQDTAKPLDPAKRVDVVNWIAEADACVKQEEAAATVAKQLEDKRKHDAEVAALAAKEAAEQGPVDKVEEPAEPIVRPVSLSARLLAGVSLMSASDVDIGTGGGATLIGGYPLPIGTRMSLEVGAALAFASGSVNNMPAAGTTSAKFFGAMANAGLTYWVNSKISVRGDLGIGALILAGASQTALTGGADTTGGLTMLRVRVGVAGEYAINPNLFVTLAPFAFSYSPAKSGLAVDSLTSIDLLVGVGYRK